MAVLELTDDESVSVASRRRIVTLTAVAFLSLIPLVVWADVLLPALPGVLWLYLGAVAVTDLVIAALLFGHAQATGVWSYLIIAGAYEFSALMSVIWVLSAPSSVVADEVLVGNESTSSYAWLSALMAIVVSVGLSALRDRRDHARGRPRGLRIPAARSAAWVAVVAAVWSMLLGVARDRLPVLVAGDPPFLNATSSLDVVIVGVVLLGLVSAVLLVPSLRRGSQIHWWMLLVVALATASLLAGLVTEYRYSLGWYAIRLFGLSASLALLLFLVGDMRIIDRQRLAAITQLAASKQRVDEANAELSRQASTDPLTGLPNRAHLLLEVQRVLAGPAPRQSVALAILDFDGFKGINDQWGHSVGDQVLSDLAQRLVACKGPDEIVARLGGDEFAWLSTEADEGVQARLEEIAVKLREPVHIGDQSVWLTSSTGFSRADPGVTAPDVLFRQADMAMYRAKRSGRDRVCAFSEALAVEARQRAAWAQAVARALRTDGLRVHYQPIWDVADNRLWGFEALVRMVGPDGVFAAEEFIEIAESGGQIRDIGAQVVRMVTQDIPELVAGTDHRIRVTVNMSIPELQDPALVAAFCTSPLGEEADRLVVEVTEATALDPVAEEALHILRGCGCAIAVDDFGTGYSNLAALQRIRPEILKIDRQFVASAASGSALGRSVIAAAVALAGSVGAVVLAEGVEDDAQLRLLPELGVSLAQGFLLGPPVPLAEARSLLNG